MKVLFLATGLLGLFAAATWAATELWTSFGDHHLTGHGWVAMALGILLTMLVGSGLTALMFYSSRHGHDEPPDLRK